MFLELLWDIVNESSKVFLVIQRCMQGINISLKATINDWWVLCTFACLTGFFASTSACSSAIINLIRHFCRHFSYLPTHLYPKMTRVNCQETIYFMLIPNLFGKMPSTPKSAQCLNLANEQDHFQKSMNACPIKNMTIAPFE